ncbi:uncharacterized protein LOC116923900 [Daphnia magna]|uniref:uncharacterized protein LOC116923900 n=1 Tax=Daphnia magna TaxID=35525 RepID=UPI001E1BC06B|nr:uncharacterized protein LOC116923900 [Daphnia magna]
MAVLQLTSEDYSDQEVPESSGSGTDIEDSASTTIEEFDVDEPAPKEVLAGKLSLKAQLATWKIENNIEFSKCDQLLKILHPYHPDLPLSTRTLVRTPTKAVSLKNISPGKYYHFGIVKGILDTLLSMNFQELLIDPLPLYVGIDGVHLTNSSSSQFWPIVGHLPFIKESPPFPIGVFHANSKPTNSNAFLLDLIEEADSLHERGFFFREKYFSVLIKSFICDAPARAMILCIKGHSSERYGCARCIGFGRNLGQLRTNDSFREKQCVLHHHCRSILENLHYLDMVKDVPLDPMHLLDLGVMKKILAFIFGTDRKKRNVPHVTLHHRTVDQIDSFITETIRKFISRIEFARQPRSSKELPRWKASEFRTFLHYFGVVIFRKFLSPEFYHHFLLLHVAVKLLSYEPWSVTDNAFANALLSRFVTQSQALYSNLFMSYNIHALFHLSSDVLKFGPLDNFSAYRFENYYGKMKRYLKKNDKPLQQLVKRLLEEIQNHSFITRKISATNEIEFLDGHNSIPILENVFGFQFRSVNIPGLGQLKCDNEADNCVFLKDMSLVVMYDFVNIPNNVVVIGKRYENQQDAYSYPCRSYVIQEYLVSSLSTNFELWNVKDIWCKAVRLPTSASLDSFVVFPLKRQ